MNRLIKFIKKIEIPADQKPILSTVFFVYLSTIIFQSDAHFTKESFSGFTIVMILFSGVCFFKDKWFKKKKFIYYIIQGVIVFDCAVIMEEGYELIFIGLIALLIAQTIQEYHRVLPVALFIVFYYSLFTIILYINEGISTLAYYLPILFLITLAMLYYLNMVSEQIRLRKKSQSTARELETAYAKLEQLTKVREREKVARDIHDILSQGLSALVLQLEALSINLELDHIDKSKEIVKMASEHARLSLKESRDIIESLRDESEIEKNYTEYYVNEISRFKEIFEGEVDEYIRCKSDMSTQLGKQTVMILRESLNNIIRHAKATTVSILIYEYEGNLNLKITDNGVGFSQKKIDQKIGHFGLMGIKERVHAVNGWIEIVSEVGSGTTIDIKIPMKEEKNEPH